MFVVTMNSEDLSNLFNTMVCECSHADYNILFKGFQGVDFMSDENVSHKVNYTTLQCYNRVMKKTDIVKA